VVLNSFATALVAGGKTRSLRTSRSLTAGGGFRVVLTYHPHVLSFQRLCPLRCVLFDCEVMVHLLAVVRNVLGLLKELLALGVELGSVPDLSECDRARE
jgi:hypothetical protein